MATQRKHWFNVTEALCRAGLDNDELACAIRLMSEMNNQRARDKLSPEEACRIRLRPGSLADVTHKRQPHAARALVARAAHALRMLAEYDVSADLTRPEFVEINWANLADLQDWHARPSGDARPAPARQVPTPTPTPTPDLGSLILRAPTETAGGLFPQDDKSPGGALVRAAKAMWPEAVKAAAQHGRRWAAKEPSATRLRDMVARLKERPGEPASILVDVVHGAIASMGPTTADFDPLRHLVPETIYRPSKFEKYLDAFRAKSTAPVDREARAAAAIERAIEERNKKALERHAEQHVAPAVAAVVDRLVAQKRM